MPSLSQSSGYPGNPRISRRGFVELGGLGLSSLGLSAALSPKQATTTEPAIPGSGRAKSCIVLFAWGGMSHLDTFDLKPRAGTDTRSVFKPISTTADGIEICEHLPHMAEQMHHVTVVRSVHHGAPSHRSAAYWNLTGHEPPNLSGNWQATRKDWPCLGSLVWEATSQKLAATGKGENPSVPGAVTLPYPIHDGGTANGQDAGFLGLNRDPVIVRPKQGKEYEGKSADFGNIDLSPIDAVDSHRLISRRSLLDSLNQRSSLTKSESTQATDHFGQQVFDMLLDSKIRDAFNLDSEPAQVRHRYGMHICGQSTLLARKLTGVGVPLVTVYCAAGDLNGSVGAHWDTHGDGFNRLQNQMLPPLDQAMSALLEDLHQTGRLDDTLVVLLTEFGRTPKLGGGGGRDHFPSAYSVLFAGAGAKGGHVYGASDKTGSAPAEKACGPADLHATVFHALGVPRNFTVKDLTRRPLAACDGSPLPIFG
jgi:hypothetical protein